MYAGGLIIYFYGGSSVIIYVFRCPKLFCSYYKERVILNPFSNMSIFFVSFNT